jgi:hypothetical protein
MAAGSDNRGQQSAQQGSSGAGAAPAWGDLKSGVSDVAGAAMERGRDFLDSARDQATGYMDKRKDDFAQSVADLGQSLRDACRQFEDRPNIRSFVDNAAGGLDEFADSIRAKSFNEIFEQAEDLIRARPGVVVAATAAMGFMMARFIKASAETIRHDRQERRRTASKARQGGSAQAGRPRAQASPGSSYAQEA